MKSVLKMKSVLIFALIVTARPLLAQAPDSKTLYSPVADARAPGLPHAPGCD
jgi:hypothetical protein